VSAEAMVTVESRDGTPIAAWRTGSGSPLVLVHGTTADHTRWALVSGLAERCSVYALDRRGRGGSGDAEPYAIEREFEDVAAVVDSLDGPVDLLGHSYGAVCSLEAALVARNLRKLVLYEPPVPTGLEIYPPGLIERLEELLAAGDRERVTTTFYREVVRMTDAEIEMLRQQPVWEARVAAAHTISRELRADEEYRLDRERFAGLEVPTLLLMGSDSPPFLKAGTEAVADVLPNAELVVMPGQQHVAMDTATELFTQEVLRFLEAG
jgi:pimeloyl-ACP methyl ester carboxylesterase